MSIRASDYDALLTRLEKDYGVTLADIRQETLAFEIRQAKRLKDPEVKIPRRGQRDAWIPLVDAEVLRKAWFEIKGALRRSVAEAAFTGVSCSICGKSLEHTPDRDVVDYFVRDFDGSLDYIELYHRQCAVKKGYKIDAKGRVVAEAVRREGGRFQVIDKKGKPVGGPHPSYSAAQKADQGRARSEATDASGAGFPRSEEIQTSLVTSEMSDTATACSRLETFKEHIVEHGSQYRLVSHSGKNLGDFDSHAAAAKHEGEVEWFKKHKE